VAVSAVPSLTCDRESPISLLFISTLPLRQSLLDDTMEPLIPFYPDINTFTLQPPIENLVVPPDSLARKTPEEIEAACEKIRSRSKTAKDIGMFGQNPFLSELAKRTDKTELSLSLPGADRPARLNQLNIELSAITLLEDLHPESDHEDRRVYKVSVAGEIMVLKLVGVSPLIYKGIQK
jgi:hypothetical protein